MRIYRRHLPLEKGSKGCIKYYDTFIIKPVSDNEDNISTKGVLVWGIVSFRYTYTEPDVCLYSKKIRH